MNRIANIISTGAYLPEIRVTNEELRERFAPLGKAETIDKFEVSTGIVQRWYAPDDWATSDLAVKAAVRALERAGRQPEEIDLILVGTDSPDYTTPATSVVVQHKLGARNAGTFDVGCACASFPTAVAVASGLLATNSTLRTVLVIGVYMMHKLADPEDVIGFFYGDGAGAAVLEPGDRPGFVGTAMQADGAYAKAWGIYSGGTAEPASEESVRAGRTQVRMVDRYPPEINNEGWPRLVRRLAHDCQFTLDEVAQVIFTQVNRSSIELVMNELDMPVEKAHMIMHETGYTGSACIPMALDNAIEQAKLARDDLVLLVGSGVGYSQAATAVRMTHV